ncbi:MAG: class I poly(R)-hydroxyalkanoic acid synthase [Paracoccaceae bacterium]
MTTNESDAAEKLERLNANLAKLDELSKRLVSALSRKAPADPALHGPSNDLYLKAAAAYLAEMMQNPSKIIEHQVSYWGKTVKHFVEAQQALTTGKLSAPADQTPEDRRFADPLWKSHPFFNYLKQQYMLNAEAIATAVGDLDSVDARDRKRIEYFSRQIIDMLSPTNFLGTNPEALTRAVETDGASLVKGLENLVRDIESNDGDLLVTLSDRDAFKVGANIATTPGQVVFRNRMLELIQYAPTTEKVHKTPLLIFPPWINKFYILDLKAQNSLIKWIVDQGYTLFVVSWVNPDETYRDVSLDTYVEEGYLAAIDAVKAITGQRSINVVGYCIAGTTLSLTLALLKKRGDKSVNAATFFTTLTDFKDQGEVGVFLSDDFVDGIEREVTDKGMLHGSIMARTFSFLRSNDLIYQPAIRSYMLGEAPPAFDLLYWNGDSTNLPAAMAVQYLRDICQNDKLAQGTIRICGETLSLADITIPVCSVACETDHIAAWHGCFDGFRQFGSKDKTFILSESGHIAGIVNPPSKNKYGHYISDAPLDDADAWKSGADHVAGSWWPHWQSWLAKRSGAMVAAREPGDSDHPPLAPAPGTYVLRSLKA